MASVYQTLQCLPMWVDADHCTSKSHSDKCHWCHLNSRWGLQQDDFHLLALQRIEYSDADLVLLWRMLDGGWISGASLEAGEAWLQSCTASNTPHLASNAMLHGGHVPGVHDQWTCTAVPARSAPAHSTHKTCNCLTQACPGPCSR